MRLAHRLPVRQLKDGAIEAELGENFFRRYLLEDMQYRLPADTVRQSLAEFGRRLAQVRV